MDLIGVSNSLDQFTSKPELQYIRPDGEDEIGDSEKGASHNLRSRGKLLQCHEPRNSDFNGHAWRLKPLASQPQCPTRPPVHRS